MPRRADYTGYRNGMLTALHCTGKQNAGGQWIWLMRCDCGDTVEFEGTAIRKNTSCGCKNSRHPRYKRQKHYGSLYYSIRSLHNARFAGDLISLDSFVVLVEHNCEYCNDPPSRRYGNMLCHGVDRVDNTKGYIEGNLVTCCYGCNHKKGTLSVEQFIADIIRIARHQTLKRYGDYDDSYEAII